ncbi:hypothetical protein QTN24_01450 [Cupriavidus sp. SZY C1]|uniref:hypothetical protein n=1 Tax=Cupriavidus sp. SZY C1 TaxID=3055037 RepID=UPI0028B9EABB|nr:hypothetical protein [Cupriavidus sp. SZY C1]MDT6960150.1 hypothetical protein [Cupriavidus sp. SZY C1]
MTDTTHQAVSLTDAEILKIASQHFRSVHNPKSEPAFIACVRAILASNAVLLSAAAHDVLTERRRQVEGEGWTPEHDDAHEGGELADAAAALVLEACDYRLAALQHWPWADAIKDASPRRNLVKAGALILAEIERLDRAGNTVAISADAGNSDGEARA